MSSSLVRSLNDVKKGIMNRATGELNEISYSASG